MTSVAGHPQVARRRVFYIPGFDPHPPRRYRELYRKESRKQAEISGYKIELQPARDETGWRVRAAIGGVQTQSRIEVLVWHDIVRSSMEAGVLGTYLALIQTAWIYLSTGTLRRLSWLAKGPVLAALYPVFMLFAQLVLAVALASAVSRMVAVGVSWLGWSFVAVAVSWALFLALVVLMLRWFRDKDDWTFAYYLMNDYAFTAGARGAYPEEVETRLREFRQRIEVALHEDIDEVLIVGHSSGAHFAVSVVADILRGGEGVGMRPCLSLLTLGQSIPMLSFLPEAHRLRSDLLLLSTANEIVWIDVSAPSDGCSFALSDPVSVSGVAPSSGQIWPLVLSAAFTKTLKPETLGAMRFRHFRLHFQYLCAFDKPGDYDYFQITAGPKTLGARFAGRQTSPSRIDVPASRFTSVLK